jgi:hypothetical protein
MALTITRNKMELPDILKSMREFRRSIIIEMSHLLRKQGGEFTIPLVFFSYIFEVSEKIAGKALSGRDNELKFIFDYFPNIDQIYRERKAVVWFYQMYRNGLCHRFTPQNLEIGPGKILTWAVYKGVRNNYSNIARGLLNICHLKIIKVKEKGESENWPNDEVYALPICINALYSDLKSAFDLYVNDVRENVSLQKNFNTWKDAVFYRRERALTIK